MDNISNPQSFRVTWEIDIDAENTVDAARKAREMQLNPESTAVVFDVHRGGGYIRVDLEDEEGEDEEDQGILPEIQSIEQVADQINPRTAQLAIATILAALGSEYEWDSEAIEWVAGMANDCTKGNDLPLCDDQGDAELEFWGRFV